MGFDRRFDRRRFLSRMGLGSGAALLSPMVASWGAEAFGQSGVKRRIVFIHDKEGVGRAARPAPGASETDFALNTYAPLEPYRKDLLVIGDLYNPHGVHQHGNFWALTLVAPRPAAHPADVLPGGPSLDRFIAQEAGKDDPISSLHLNAWGNQATGKHPTDVTMCADGPGKPYVPFPTPASAYKETFAKLTLPGGPAAASPASLDDRSVLDAVMDDVGRLQTRLAMPERRKLDQYLTSLRSLETRIARLATAGAGCRKPEAPSDASAARTPERMLTNLDLVTSALACSLTRVGYLKLGGGLDFLGIPDCGTHNMGHGYGQPETQRRYDGYVAQTMVNLRKKLEAFPDGSGTLADSTMIVWLNQNGGTHHDGGYDCWAMILGGGARYFRTGRYVKLSSSALMPNDPRRPASGPAAMGASGFNARILPDRNLGELCVSLANAMGLPIKSFGDPRFSTGPLPGLV